MQVVAQPTWEAVDWATPLGRAHTRGSLPPELAPPRIATMRESSFDPALCDALRREPGAGSAVAWDALATPGAQAVVTGQQPGCLGGPLLVLYKAATAVALARRLSETASAPVVPVFWNAGDDDDFDEVARVGWWSREGRFDLVELPRRGHTGWIGDLPAALDRDAAAAVLPGAEGDVRALLPHDAKDHGVWVATLLGRCFPELAIVDGRSPALRRAAAPLFGRYLDTAAEITAAITRQSERLTAHGFTPVLSPGSLRAGLHLSPDRRRAKVSGDWQPLRTALETAPETVSPNVVLRALMQDALLPTCAQVVGPAELAYLIELRPARAALGVFEPALVPRLGATLLPAAMWDSLQSLDPRAWLHDPAAALAGAVPRSEDARFEAALADLRARVDVASTAAPVRDRALRKLETWAQELRAAQQDVARAQWLDRHPALRSVETWVRPRGKPQERLLAALWLAIRPNASDAVVEWAAAHLAAFEAGHARHWLVAVEPDA